MNHPFSSLQLRHLSFEVRLRVLNDIVWGSFPGSVVHGVLGYTARRRHCAARSQQCPECFLLYSCFYSRLFEARPPQNTARMRKYPRIPPGLMIALPSWNRGVVEAGERITLKVSLFGSAANAALSLILTIDEAFRQGVGSRIAGHQRGSAAIEEIRDAAGLRAWRSAEPLSDPSVLQPTSWAQVEIPVNHSFQLTFTSPCRIAAKGKISGHPSFRDLTATLLRRITNIAYFYCGEEIQADFRALLDGAQATQFEGEFQQVRCCRYSARQKRRIMMHAIVGAMRVWNCPSELVPWIALGSHLGVGKGTSMGMGQYEIECDSREFQSVNQDG